MHQYNSYGSYPVELEVTSSFGCTDRYRDTIDVYRAPEPQISLNGGCLNIPVIIADISDTISTGTVSWLWDFGDGTSDSTSSATTHQYTTAGTYTVTLTAVNANGCRTITSQVVAMDPIPNADFAGGPGCEDAPTQFTNTSTVTQGSITSYQWLFGDSTISTSQNPSHTFTEPGTYNVTLIVGSSLGCYDTIVQQIVIYPSPVSNFTFNQAAGCGPLLINFFDSSYVSIGNVIAWNWDFGDGSANDSTQNPSHTYYSSGSYPVTLTVTTNNGCQHTNTINNAITIYPSPQAAFEPDPYETTILQPLISFDNQTTGGNLYWWNFGDGGTSSLMNPSHAYGDTGTYTVNLYTVNSFGCEDTAIRTVVILPVWTVYIPNAFTPNNDGTNEVFTIKGIGIIDYNLRVWDRWGELIFEGDNRPWDGSVKQTEVYAKKDVYVYQVVLKDVFGVTHHRKGTVTLIR
ncbi:MAG: PKD domain-containing protein [Bacteroidetes bacterium]|nr:PKD domain-containing protein [Bacteroidota bacterium]